jgi:hypothetical protein
MKNPPNHIFEVENLPIKETLVGTEGGSEREEREWRPTMDEWMNGCKLGTSFIHLFTRFYCELISMSFSFRELHGTIPILTRGCITLWPCHLH